MKFEYNPEKHKNPIAEYKLSTHSFITSSNSVMILTKGVTMKMLAEYHLAKFYFIIHEGDIKIFERHVKMDLRQGVTNG